MRNLPLPVFSLKTKMRPFPQDFVNLNIPMLTGIPQECSIISSSLFRILSLLLPANFPTARDTHRSCCFDGHRSILFWSDGHQVSVNPIKPKPVTRDWLHTGSSFAPTHCCPALFTSFCRRIKSLDQNQPYNLISEHALPHRTGLITSRI